MDTATAKRLNEITAGFYRRESESFSSTRQSPWAGWDRLAAFLPDGTAELRVLDVGCGNLRFERFLADVLPETRLAVTAVDGCAGMAGLSVPNADVSFHEIDVVELLAAGASDAGREGEGGSGCGGAARSWPDAGHDLVVAFGLMHHISLPAWRGDLMRLLVDAAAPGGLVAASFWQFTRSERLARLAREVTARASSELGIELSADDGDWMLGWQGRPGAFRYCHDFSDDEVSRLVEEAASRGARPIADFLADGREGNLNRYVVLQRDVD